MVSPARQVTIEEARDQLDRLLSDIERDGGETIITRNGRAVARLAGVASDPQGRPLEPMKGQILRYDQPLDPVLGPLEVDQ